VAPLDGLDADGAVECGLCGLRQRLEVSSWSSALEHAHAVGDLAGPDPEGRTPHPSLWIGSENTLATVGDQRTFEQATSGVLSLEASPGNPVCSKCAVPVMTSVTGPGAVATHCSRCGEGATYALGEAALGLGTGVVGAVAPEHRTDRPRARAFTNEAG